MLIPVEKVEAVWQAGVARFVNGAALSCTACRAFPASHQWQRPPSHVRAVADLHWYELDQQDVVTAKEGLLKQLGAELPPSEASDEPPTPGTPVGSGLTKHLRWVGGDDSQGSRATLRREELPYRGRTCCHLQWGL